MGTKSRPYDSTPENGQETDELFADLRREGAASRHRPQVEQELPASRVANDG
jgi:hypothetical protein